MDCRARGRRCPEAGKDPAAAAPGRERPWPAGASGGALFGARPPGSCRCWTRRGSGGGGWGAWSRGCGRGTLASMVARSRAKRGGAEPDPSPGIPHPSTLGAAGIRGTLRARGMEMVLGKRATPQLGGVAPRGRSSKDPNPQRTHTLVGRPARLTQALPAPRGHPEGQTTDICTRIHTSVHMCTQTYLPHTSAHWGTVTSSESASAYARSAARTHNPWPYRATDHNRV